MSSNNRRWIRKVIAEIDSRPETIQWRKTHYSIMLKENWVSVENYLKSLPHIL